MNALARLSYEPGILAEELLPDFKAWARIDHTDDNSALELMLSRTMGLLERQWGVAIAPAIWEWVPRSGAYALPTGVPENRLACACPPLVSWSYVPIPLRGITGATVAHGGVDVSNTFALAGDTVYGDFGQMYLQALVDPIQTDDVVTLNVETSATMLPPELVDVLFRYALFIWENRESATERGMAEVPDWINRAWGPFWSPRV
jgi:hypothetical protein